MEQIGAARPDERGAIEALLQATGLPHDDVAQHLGHFLVAREVDRIVGAIGLEVHGDNGLMRSLAVAPERRGHGVARRLYATLLSVAQRTGLRRLYLIAPTAQSWFVLLGFRAVSAEAVPAEIRATREFQTLSGRSTILVRTMPRA